MQNSNLGIFLNQQRIDVSTAYYAENSKQPNDFAFSDLDQGGSRTGA